jgi:tetratricopeptide (TPR) repeat protein
MALVTLKRILATAAIALALASIAGGCGAEEKADREEQAEEEALAAEELSVFLQPADSLRWLNFLTFSPQDSALAWVMMASLYLSNEYPRAALHYLQEASRHDLDRPVIYLNMGYAYNMLGDTEKATEAFSMFVQRDPGSILSQEIFRIVEKYRALDNHPPQ